jgi:uncharacterized repeat protein (TIGR03847 family)
MNSHTHIFKEPDRFTVGTVGEPGDRTFFIQARRGNRLISLSLEKSQVQALSERLEYMVREVRQSDPTIFVDRLPRDDAPLDTPIEEEFRIGVIGLAFDSEATLIQIDLQAVSENASAEEELVDLETLKEGQEFVRVLISPAEALRFSKRAHIVVSAGRQPCPFCGGPIDLRGHLCPRANGYRR